MNRFSFVRFSMISSTERNAVTLIHLHGYAYKFKLRKRCDGKHLNMFQKYVLAPKSRSSVVPRDRDTPVYTPVNTDSAGFVYTTQIILGRPVERNIYIYVCMCTNFG